MSSRNITLIALIRFAQSFHLYIHAYALILLDRGLNLFQISTIESVVIGTVFLMEMPTGVIADRIGRKWSVIAAITFMMLAELLFLFSQSYALYLVVAILTGTGFAFASGAIEALVYDSLPIDKRDNLMKRAMGQTNSAAMFAFFIAPIVGAFIIADGTSENFTVAIALTVLALIFGMVVSLFLEEPPTEWDAERPNSLQIFTDSLTEIRSNATLRHLILLTIFTFPFTGTLISTFAAPYLTSNGTDIFFVGVALSSGSLLAAITQRYAYKVEEWLGQKRAILILLGLPALIYFALAMVAGAIVPLMLIILMYGTNDMKAPLFSAYQNKLIQSNNQATMLSIISMFLNLFVAIVSPIYAAIATWSLPVAFVMMACVIVIGIVVVGVPDLEEETSTY